MRATIMCMKHANTPVVPRGVFATSLCASVLSLALLGTAFAQSIIKIDGSSTVFPVTEAVAEEFQNESQGKVKVTVGISGTGGGFKKFVRGETDVQNASRPILKAELDAASQGGIEFIELPICYDALTIAVNPKNTWLKSITIADLKKMWEPSAQVNVTTWKQVNAAWPASAFKLFGAGSDSGTFDYFTEAVVGKAKSSRGDYTSSEDDNTLVRGIEGDQDALGYLPYAYFAPHADKLRALPVDAGKGAIMPSPETVKDGSYPLSRPLFIYVNVKSLAKPEVKQFVEFYLKNVPELAAEVKYLPLPAKAYELAMARLSAGTKGSVFEGTPEVHVTIEELLKRGGAK
jgi:phosphate transport system substrate-binding protein